MHYNPVYTVERTFEFEVVDNNITYHVSAEVEVYWMEDDTTVGGNFGTRWCVEGYHFHEARVFGRDVVLDDAEPHLCLRAEATMFGDEDDFFVVYNNDRNNKNEFMKNMWVEIDNAISLEVENSDPPSIMEVLDEAHLY